MPKQEAKDIEHDLLGSLLDDDDNPTKPMRAIQSVTRVQAFSAPPALFDIGYNIDFDCLDTEEFDSPDPEDLNISEAFSKKQLSKRKQPELFPVLNNYRKMSCEIALLQYYETTDSPQFDYYQYSSVFTPEEELLSNLAQVGQWAKDQNGSRTVQNIFESETEQKKDAIFHAIFKDSMNLIKDRFGNYVFQKIFEKGLKSHKQLLMESLWGTIVELSLHSYGCRVIQKAIQFISGNDEAEKQFMLEIGASSLTLIENQNGNHVIQKCFETFPHKRVIPLVEVLSLKLQALAFHAFGCRVIQKYLENHREQQESQLILERLLKISIPLSQCQYGNYVMQHIVTKCKQERLKVFQTFIGHVVDLSTNKYASNVVEKAIQSSGSNFCESLADWFLLNEKDLIFLSKHQFGNYVVQSMMERVSKQKRIAIRTNLKDNASEISKSQFGRHVLLQLDKNRR